MPEITQLLDAAEAGDRQAAAELLPLVYDELRKLAAARMAAEAPGHTLDATALVHEAYLRLVGDQQFDGRGHFFAAAAEAMRRILVDHARDRNRQKRGGGRNRVDLDRLTGPAAPPTTTSSSSTTPSTDWPRSSPSAAELVKLRFFAGMTLGEAADARESPAGPPTGTGRSRGPGSPTPWPAGNSVKKFSDSVAHSRAERGIEDDDPSGGEPCPTPTPG